METIRVVRDGGLEAGPSTAGMIRSQAFAAEDLWVGEARTDPGTVFGWHHHGNHTTVGRVLSGRIRFELEGDTAESIEIGPGDFFMVPPHVVHREGNPGSELQVCVLVRTGTGPTVVNVESPASRRASR